MWFRTHPQKGIQDSNRIALSQKRLLGTFVKELERLLKKLMKVLTIIEEAF